METEGYGAFADWWQQDSVIGIDPTTGTQKFTVPVNYTSSGHPLAANLEFGAYSFIIAGDGYAYLPYTYNNHCDGDTPQITHFMLLRINSSGAYDKFEVMNWVADWPLCANQYLSVNTITNADQGILLTWELGYQLAPMVATAPHSLHRPSRGYRVSGTTPRFDDGLPPPTFGMALTTGASASVVSAPQVPGQTATVVPVLQAQDGSFVGYAEDGNTGNNDMVAFDATGNVRWMVPNEQPQIATADGGVIGQSGITYDQNGNATGQVRTGVPNWAGQIYTVGTSTSGVELDSSWVNFGSGFASVPGGNPSGTATSVANLGLSEGFPLWSLFGGGPKCVLGADTDRVLLGGAASQQYTNLRQELLTLLGSLTPTSACAKFFNADPQRSAYLGRLTTAVTNQVAYDGLLANLSMYAAGEWTQKTTQLVTWPKFKTYPVCSQYWNGSRNWSRIVATAQVQPPGTDVYLATQKDALKNLTQATILHESLHNLTGLDDPDLYKLLTGKKLPDGPTAIINTVLEQNGCAGTQ
jgi:hypothetical protein